MAYNYLTLVNDVCRRVNETELTSSNFSSAVGQYGYIKDSINYALRDINNDEYEWPFNYATQEDTLTAGDNRYAFQSDYKTSSMDTFRIKRNATFGNETKLLEPKTYEDYLKHYIDQEYNTSDTSIRAIPRYVFKAPNLEYCIAPTPDKAYELVYEYYTIPTDLSAHDDVPTIPFQFRSVILAGAMYYNNEFRGDVENLQFTRQRFEEQVKKMRSIYINRYNYASSRMLDKRPNANNLERVS